MTAFDILDKLIREFTDKHNKAYSREKHHIHRGNWTLASQYDVETTIWGRVVLRLMHEINTLEAAKDAGRNTPMGAICDRCGKSVGRYGAIGVCKGCASIPLDSEVLMERWRSLAIDAALVLRAHAVGQATQQAIEAALEDEGKRKNAKTEGGGGRHHEIERDNAQVRERSPQPGSGLSPIRRTTRPFAVADLRRVRGDHD